MPDHAPPGGDALAAQAPYSVPAPQPVEPVEPAVDYDCSDFAFEEDALVYHDRCRPEPLLRSGPPRQQPAHRVELARERG
jgi:hypothetical protein